MNEDFSYGQFGAGQWPVCRLGISGSYRPGERAIRRALDEGVNFVFLFGFDTQTVRALRGTNADRRERLILATGAYNYLWGYQDLKKTLEKRLRQLKTDYIDVFHFLGVTKREHFPERAQDELAALKEGGRVRAISMSCHDRKFAGELAGAGKLDALMIRYNAAHRGAEEDILPYLGAHRVGVVGYTATRWGFLMRRPRGWKGRVMTAGECYRFALSDDRVQVCLTAPRSERELVENLDAVRKGRPAEEELRWVREFGDEVRAKAGWFW
jgi:aryl-alcohol dehydrogenase-like predicted oxidoreductase